MGEYKGSINQRSTRCLLLRIQDEEWDRHNWHTGWFSDLNLEVHEVTYPKFILLETLRGRVKVLGYLTTDTFIQNYIHELTTLGLPILSFTLVKFIYFFKVMGHSPSTLLDSALENNLDPFKLVLNTEGSATQFLFDNFST